VAGLPDRAGIEVLSEQIREYTQRIEQQAQQSYPQVALLKQVKGVGSSAVDDGICPYRKPRGPAWPMPGIQCRAFVR